MDPDLVDKWRQDIKFTETLNGHSLLFHTTWGLFSPRAIDEGTRLLLERIEIEATANCIDLGCGYGPIGMTLAKMAPQGKTLLLDKDFVAVDYSNANIHRNKVTNASAILSNGFDAVKKKPQWDIIVSNIPAKVGKEMLTIYLIDALNLLRSDGKIYVVTINGLRQFMKRNMQEIFGNYKKVKQGKNYTVAVALKK